ncbi:MAG: sensor histidine kinase [Myxococcales bacterium]|nr:sensor histidine kinase [Myxococcales bacterium]
MTRKDLGALDVGRLLSLLAHDLKSPIAALCANVDALADGGPGSAEVLDDLRLSLTDLRRAAEQMTWIGQVLVGERPLRLTEGDVGSVVAAGIAELPASRCAVEIVRTAPLVARGASAAMPVLRVVLANADEHAPRGPILVRVFREGDRVVLETTDAGSAVAAELREEVFTLSGQHAAKTAPKGRYGRFAGMLAASALAESVGGQLTAGGAEGRATFRLELQAV